MNDEGSGRVLGYKLTFASVGRAKLGYWTWGLVRTWNFGFGIWSNSDGSGLLPAVAIAVLCHGVLGREFRLHRFFLSFGQRFLFMLFGDEHVERWNNEKSEDRSNSHAAHQHQTDGISCGRARTRYQRQRKMAGHGRDARHHDRAQTNARSLSNG